MKRSNLSVRFGSIVVVITIILLGCGSPAEPSLDPDQIEWVTNIIRHDSCKFISNRGSEAMLRLTANNINNPDIFTLLDLRGSPYPPSYPRSAFVTFDIADMKGQVAGVFLIRLPESGEIPAVNTSLGNRYLFFPGKAGAKLKTQDFIYPDTIFKECFVMDSINSYLVVNINSPVDRDIKKAVVSKEYGLIYYSFSDGEEFFREFD